MVIVIISGIPKGVKLPKFIGFIKRVIFKQDVDIQSYTKPILGTRYKEMSFIMKSNDARKAVRCLNGFQFRYANEHYLLTCWIERPEDSQVFHDDIEDTHQTDLTIDEYEPARKCGRYASGSQSVSPHSDSNELSEINLKIHLIRKQRILMEEETKLLLEKKKLKFLQGCVSDDVEKLKKFDEILGRDDTKEMSEFLNSVQPPEVIPIQPKVKTPSLPKFLGPCKIITAQMKPKINAHSEINDGNKKFLWKLLRPTLKKRIYSIVHGKGYLPCKFIVRKYRAVYPKATDKDLINELLKTINGSCWPTKKAVAKNEIQSENPDADFSTLNKTDEFWDTNNFVDLNEFVDMENDEDWGEDDDKINEEKYGTNMGDDNMKKAYKDFEKAITEDARERMQMVPEAQKTQHTTEESNIDETKSNENNGGNTALSADVNDSKQLDVVEANHASEDAGQLKQKIVVERTESFDGDNILI